MKGKYYKFDHIGVVVKDINRAMDFFKKVFGFEMPKTGPYSKIASTEDGLKYALVSSKGKGEEETFIEFLEPPASGARDYIFDLLRAEGTIVELCITVEDIEGWYDKLKGMGLTPLDLAGRPLVDKKYVLMKDTGSKCFYLPRSQTYGVQIEILERPGDPYRKH